MEAENTKEYITYEEVKLTGYLSEREFPESLRLVRYYNDDDSEFPILMMRSNFIHWMLPVFIRKDGYLSLS